MTRGTGDKLKGNAKEASGKVQEEWGEATGDPDQQATQVRDAIRLLFPEAVTLVSEARQGLA